MKREEKIERELRIKQLFHAWCKKHHKEPDPDAFIEYDATQNKALLDHQEASEKGYYYHLRMQATARIASWANLKVSIKIGNSPYPVPKNARKPTRKVNGTTQWIEEIVENEISLASLINQFRMAIGSKTETLYFLMAERDELTAKNRKNVQQIFAAAEEAAYTKAQRKEHADAAD